jgi:hypothetical protein
MDVHGPNLPDPPLDSQIHPDMMDLSKGFESEVPFNGRNL